MKIAPNFKAFNISAKGMGFEKKRMDLIAENIANLNTTKTENGSAYKRKFLQVTNKDSFDNVLKNEKLALRLKTGSNSHISKMDEVDAAPGKKGGLSQQVMEDKNVGETVYMPEHPDADADGYVEMPNVNVVNEMVDMIASTRSYEANLEAFNASKQIAKDSLEI